MRMAKKGLAASGLVDAFKNFNQKTSGEFTVYNIPLSEEKAQKMNKLNKLSLELDTEKNPIKAASLRNDIKKLEKEIPEIAQLKMLGIDYCVLPKLNGSNQTIQVGVANVDDQKFKNWYLNHLTTELQGGQKNLARYAGLQPAGNRGWRGAAGLCADVSGIQRTCGRLPVPALSA